MRRRMLFNKTEYQKVHNTTYLYYLGDECVDITGGWSEKEIYSGRERGIHNKLANCLEYGDERTDSYNGGGFTTNNIIDYDKIIGICVCIEQTASSTANNLRQALCDSSGDRQFNYDYTPIINVNKNGTYDKAIVVKFSENKLSQSGYVNVFSYPWTYVRDTIQTRLYSFAMFKQDDLQGLSAYGNDIATIISNATSLLQDHNAVVYMLNQCTGDFMWTALADSTFVSTLRTSPYYSEIMADEDWNKALALLEV